MIILPSFFGNYPTIQDALSFVFRSAVMFAGIYAVQESEKQLEFGMVAGLIIILINSLGVFRESANLNFYFSFIVYIFFYVYVAYRLMTLIIKTDNVKIGVLYAAINVYLLMGIIGGYMFMLIENANPGSLNNLAIENLSNPSKFFYFSFITLSTLGYGDISPAAPASQSLAMILSSSGPLYLTILVALLVSRFEHTDMHSETTKNKINHTMNQDLETIGLFQKYTWLKWLILIPSGIGGLYVTSQLIPKDFEKSSIFTQYGELNDTLLTTNLDTTAAIIDTSLISVDSLLKTNSAKVNLAIDSLSEIDSAKIISVVDTLAKAKETIDTGQVETVVIDESYKFGGTKESSQINQPSNFTRNQKTYQPIASKETIFNELLMTPNSTDSVQSNQMDLLSSSLISVKTVLKIAATVGKNVLMHGNTEDSRDIFESMVAEENIISITLCDREGKVIYTSNAKFMNGNIQTIYPTLDTKNHAMGWGSDQTELMTSIAIHHTYGRIGNVVLVSRKL